MTEVREKRRGGPGAPSAVKETRRFYQICLSVGLLLIFLVTLCKCVMLAFAYDYAAHFFKTGPALSIFEGLFALALLFALSGFFLFRRTKKMGETMPAPSSLEALLAALCGFFLFATVAMQCIYIFCELDPGRYDVSHSLFLTLLRGAGESWNMGQTLQSLAILMALPAGVYFLYDAFAEKPKDRLRAGFGFFFLLWTVLCLLVVNFDMSIPMNSPERLGPLLAFLSMMLFATAEIRLLLRRGKLRLLFPATMLAVLLCLSDGAPTLLLSFAGRFPMGIATIYACIEISVGVYAVLRLLSFVSQAGGKEPLRLKTDSAEAGRAQPLRDEFFLLLPVERSAEEAVDEEALFSPEDSETILPLEKVPAEEDSAEEAPVEEDSAGDTPAENAPAEGEFAEEAPAEEIPAEEDFAEEAPMEEDSAEDTPAENAPVEGEFTEEAPAEEISAEEDSAEEAPVEEDSAENTPAENAPVEGEFAEEAPAEEIPAEEDSAEEAPVEEIPAEEKSAKTPPPERPDSSRRARRTPKL